MASSLPGLLSSTAASAQPATGRRMGGTPTAFLAHVRAAREGGSPFDIVEHCHNFGLAGVQTNPPSLDPEALRKFRQRLDTYQMHLVSDPRLPKDAGELPAFEAQVKAFKEAGAVAFHAALTGRRYEDFASFEPWKQMFEQRQRQVELAEPILRKYKVPLGIENHKGWRSAEQAAWMKRLGSEWVGVCLDFGNNLSLCEDPLETAKTLAPFTVYTHIKDMGVEPYEDGFLLAEVPFGEGIVDLPQIIAMLRKKDPNMIFNLEMITRDPLKIPVFTPKYWATFDDAYSPLPGRDLAKVLSLVQKNHPRQPLARTAGLSPAQQMKIEDELNRQCIAYAHEKLGL
ncbi:sugar phosphate isomerase/epimerase family protein [uncultured Paludibaculum sp.]|uniref:sugar phosphate isomerase/epimerase family protein n=1 Tax=uncultured Paludibaculum sp. TaxID=1765020 RepID=UPI00374D0321